MNVKPLMMRISYVSQRQVDSATAKAAIIDPRAGPTKPLADHADTTQATLTMDKRSVAESPPVASKHRSSDWPL